MKLNCSISTYIYSCMMVGGLSYFTASYIYTPAEDFGDHTPLGMETALNDKEISCLAKNIREEAVYGHRKDMIHIAQGTINRVKSSRFPNTICGVVYQNGQMSWTKNPAKRARGYQQEHYDLAEEMLLGLIDNPAPDCPFTNWDNLRLDGARTFNKKVKNRISSCNVKPTGTPHVYIAYK